jgi:hypothetical protein
MPWWGGLILGLTLLNTVLIFVHTHPVLWAPARLRRR